MSQEGETHIRVTEDFFYSEGDEGIKKRYVIIFAKWQPCKENQVERSNTVLKSFFSL